MSNWFTKLTNNPINEQIESFRPKNEKQTDHLEGEGVEDLQQISGYGNLGLNSFNNFYSNYINRQFSNEIEKIKQYRQIAQMPEIADVVEDATLECTQEDQNGDMISLSIVDDELKNNDNIVNNLQKEFRELFYERINLKEELWNLFYTYFIDGRFYYERLINTKRKTDGIVGIKRLPTETMDYAYDPNTGEILAYFQYITGTPKKPLTMDEAQKDPNVIVFYPDQIGYVNYGIYGQTKRDVIGYLEKAKQPYNQLKLLETSVVIYRLIRSPERFVFTIDTGSMPKDKAMRYVEKIKQKMMKKQTYDSNSGQLTNDPEIFSMLENFFLPQCLRLSTEIETASGTKTLSQMIDDFNNGIQNEVYSVDQKTGKIIKGVVEWAGITKKNADLVRVNLDNGKFIDCTPDHKFVMRDGSEVEAKDLSKGDSLMPFYTRKEKINKKSNDYIQYFDNMSNEWKFSHRMFGPKSKRGYAIHHKDFNRYNNHSSNLVSMTIKDHIDLHYKSNKERNSHIPLLDALNIPENREKQKTSARDNMIKRFSDIKEREKMGRLLSNRWAEQRDIFMNNVCSPKTNEHKKSLSISIKNKWENDKDYRERVSKSSKERWNDPDFSNHMSKVKSAIIDDKCHYYITYELIKNNFPSMEELIKSLSKNTDFMCHWKEINDGVKGVKKTHLGKNSFYSIIKDMGFDTYTELKNNIVINHKVVSIEILDFKEDTGCLTIKDPGDNHNFSLTSGVFVKNSADGRGSNVTTVGGNPSGFAELEDIYYFARKMYRSLKYPQSRVTSMQERAERDVLFSGASLGEITRDEIKWARFLERQQNRVMKDFKELFLLHLKFKGVAKQYNLTLDKFNINLVSPNNYKDQMKQTLLDTKMSNYQNLSNNPEFSKTYLMRKYLDFDEYDLKANKQGFDDDKKYIPKDAEDNFGF